MNLDWWRHWFPNRWWLRRGLLQAFLPLALIWAASSSVSGHVPSWLALKIAYGSVSTEPTQDWASSWQGYMNSRPDFKAAHVRMSHTRCAPHAGVYICSYRLTGHACMVLTTDRAGKQTCAFPLKGTACGTAMVDDTGQVYYDSRGDPAFRRVGCGEVMPSTKTRA